jgi:hypothetical protein
MRAARGILIALGLALMGVAGLVLLADVPPERYLGIAVWVGAAIVVHDGVVAPITVAAGLGAARALDRVGRRGIAVAQGALFVGATLTAIALPAIIASARGNANPTVLVGSYAFSLVVVWAVLIAVATAAVGRPSARAVKRHRLQGAEAATDTAAGAGTTPDEGEARTK